MSDRAGTSNARSNVRTVVSLLNEDGSWADSTHFQVPEVEHLDKEELFRSYDEYNRTHGVSLPVFDEQALRRDFGRYESLQHRSSFDVKRHGDKVSRAFQIAGGFSWREATADERLYSRPRDGAIAMPLSHFKAGLRVRPHRFLIALFKQEFRCSPAQFSPNAIRLILWFIAACNRLHKQPTFKTFFSIFYVKASKKEPFYELVQFSRNARLGTAVSGYNPLKKPRCMKNWWNEYIMLLGGEWAYMPGFCTECLVTYKVPPELQTVEVRRWLHQLVRVFGEAWDVSVFHHVSSLKQHNCECVGLLLCDITCIFACLCVLLTCDVCDV